MFRRENAGNKKLPSGSTAGFGEGTPQQGSDRGEKSGIFGFWTHGRYLLFTVRPVLLRVRAESISIPTLSALDPLDKIRLCDQLSASDL